MNDRPTSDPAPDAPNGAPSFRVPDGPPPGTSARGSLAAPAEDAEAPAAEEREAGPEAEAPGAEVSEGEASEAVAEAREDEEEADDLAHTPWPEDDWASFQNLESADGRPIESPYQDEAALHAALASEDLRDLGAYDYPLEDSNGYSAHSHDEASTSPVTLAKADDGGAAPPSVPAGTSLDEKPFDENAPANDREMDLVEHLAELRTRILWCVSAIAVAMVGTWNFARPLEELIIAPAKTALKQAGVQNSGIVVLSPTEGFMLQFNISLISALILTAPFLLYQIWRFVEPAMTRNEKRFTGIMVPFSSLLFFMGCALAYAMSPLFFAFFAMFVPPGTIANWSFAESAVLLAKMLLVCGFCFQVPVFTIFLNKSGVVSRNVLIEYWRHVVVVIFVLVAIITPTWDPVSLMVCALPPCILYALSIWLVKWL